MLNNKVKIGRDRESIARKFLQEKGLKFIDRNVFIHRLGELDLIFQERSSGNIPMEYVFVEVRSVSRFLPLQIIVSPKKLQRMQRSVQLWLISNKKNPLSDRWRIDLLILENENVKFWLKGGGY